VVGQGPGAIRYHFNQRNLLTAQENYVDGPGWTLQAEFVYDGDSNRLQQIDHTGSQPLTTTYTNDIVGLSQVLVSDDGTTQTTNLFGLDLIHQDDGTETRFMLADGLGSVRVEMVGSAIETATTYEPYGKVLAQAGETGTVYSFTGEQYDALTSLVYLRARYYNPSLKLFLSRDPFPGYATLSISQNGYAYVHANPVNLIDPTGEVVWFVPIIVAGAVYGAGYLAYDFFVPQDVGPDNGWWWLGQFLGYENLRHDLDALRNPCVSTGRKIWAGMDATLNAALGISMVHGFANSVKVIPAARQLTGHQLRLFEKSSVATEFGEITAKWGDNFFRPLGERWFTVKTGYRTGWAPLRHGAAHEIAHIQQEFAVGKNFARFVTRPFQQLSKWSTDTFGQVGAYLPTYALNPVEVHAAASGGLGNISNLSLLVASRAEAWFSTYVVPEIPSRLRQIFDSSNDVQCECR
jgi:RHS repeat-associated protein